MAKIISMRARRFQALYALLTGAAHSKLSRLRQKPDALMKDVGDPEYKRPEGQSGPLGRFPADTCRRQGQSAVERKTKQ